MKRTTLKIDEKILRRLKQKAAVEGTSLQDVANQLLRQALATPHRGSYTLSMEGWRADLQPGVDILDRDALFDLMNRRAP